MKVLVIGQVVYDIILPVDEYPKENTKSKIFNKKEFVGGSAGNASKVLSRYGFDVYFAGLIGNDVFGSSIKNYFEKNNINTKYLEVNNNVETPTSYILSNSSNGSRTVITNRTKDAKMNVRTVEENFDIIYSDGYEIDFFKEAVKNNPNALKIVDAGAIKDDIIEIAKMCDYLICSKNFAEDYTNIKVDYNNTQSLIDIYKSLKNNFNNNIIITLEDHGAFTYIDEYKLIPSIKVDAVDSCGAGDIFHGAFTYFITSNYNTEKAIRLANIVAAHSCKTLGTENIILYDDLIKEYGNYI